MSASSLALLPAAGAVAGLLGAVLGIGGGVFLVPALVLYFGLPLPHAVGAGLVCVIATSSAVASVNLERGLVNVRLGMVLELSTVAGAMAGALLAARLSPALLEGLFAVVLLGVAVLLYRAAPPPADEAFAGDVGRLGASYDDPAAGGLVEYRVRRLPVALGVSGIAGALSGLLGIGGGVFKVPALRLFCGVPMKAAAATSNFMIGVTAAASALLYFSRGEVEPVVTSLVVLGVLLGSAFGTRVNRGLADRFLRRTFSALLLLLSAQLLRKALHG